MRLRRAGEHGAGGQFKMIVGLVEQIDVRVVKIEIDLGEIENLLDRVAGAEGMADEKDPLGVRRAELRVDHLFLDRFVAGTRKLKIGHPLDPETDLSSLITVKEAERVESWIDAQLATTPNAMGARR